MSRKPAQRSVWGSSEAFVKANVSLLEEPLPEARGLLPGLAIVEAPGVFGEIVESRENLVERFEVQIDVPGLHEARHAQPVADEQAAPDDVERLGIFVHVVDDVAPGRAAA